MVPLQRTCNVIVTSSSTTKSNRYVAETLVRYIYRPRTVKIEVLKCYILYTRTDVVTVSKEMYKTHVT